MAVLRKLVRIGFFVVVAVVLICRCVYMEFMLVCVVIGFLFLESDILVFFRFLVL